MSFLSRDAQPSRVLVLNGNPARETLCGAMAEKIADEALWMPMYGFNVNYGLSNDLSFTPHPDEFARFWQASWK